MLHGSIPALIGFTGLWAYSIFSVCGKGVDSYITEQPALDRLKEEIKRYKSLTH